MRHINIFLVSLLFATNIFALPSDSQQSMHINANSTLFNYKSGFNLYQGDVKVDQGETHLTSDKLTTQNDAHHKMQEAIAYGTTKTLAHYWTIPKLGDKLMHAYAKTIRFFPQKSKVILEGSVKVSQGSNTFEGEYVEYNVKDQTVSVPPMKKSRTTIIIDANTIKS